VYRRLPPRRSSAALRSEARGESARTILIAFLANVVIAAAKLVAGLLSGSAAMLSEAGHSAADSVNEVLLGVSLRRARHPADPAHPIGHGRERYLWAFLAAIASFLIGGCLSVALAVRALVNRGSTVDGLAAWLVLAVAFVAEGASWLQGIGQARREARQHGRPVRRYLLGSSDPALRAVVVEDSAALVGLLLAAGGLLLSELAGSDTPDALASLLIGVLLMVTAFGLARPLADYLLGHSLPPEQLEQAYAILAGSPAVEEVLSLQAVYTGPEEAIMVAKVHPAAGLTSDELARAMDELDHAVRTALPEVAEIYLDVTSHRADAIPPDHGGGQLDLDSTAARPRTPTPKPTPGG
jgi:cation diffusion facilitator family transporter